MAQPMANNNYSQPPPYEQVSNPMPVIRTMHIYHEGLIHRKTHVLDSDKVTTLYSAEQNSGLLFSSKPHMTIRNANQGAVVGTVTFPSFSRRIDLTLHDQKVDLESTGIMSLSHRFKSPRGNVLKWKRDGMFSGGDLVCLDETADASAQLVSRFEMSRFSISKMGKFEVSPAVQGVVLDEVVVSLLAMLEYMRRRRSQSSGGGGGA